MKILYKIQGIINVLILRAEVRRTGYPKLHTRLNSDNPDMSADAIVRRLTIVSGELDNNAAAAAVAQELSAVVGIRTVPGFGGMKNNDYSRINLNFKKSQKKQVF